MLVWNDVRRKVAIILGLGLSIVLWVRVFNHKFGRDLTNHLPWINLFIFEACVRRVRSLDSLMKRVDWFLSSNWTHYPIDFLGNRFRAIKGMWVSNLNLMQFQPFVQLSWSRSFNWVNFGQIEKSGFNLMFQIWVFSKSISFILKQVFPKIFLFWSIQGHRFFH